MRIGAGSRSCFFRPSGKRWPQKSRSPLLVVRPDARRRHAGQVRAHDHLDRQRRALARDRARSDRARRARGSARRRASSRTRTRRREFSTWPLSGSVPSTRSNALMRSVTTMMRRPSARRVVVADLALVLLAELRKIRVRERMRERLLQSVGVRIVHRQARYITAPRPIHSQAQVGGFGPERARRRAERAGSSARRWPSRRPVDHEHVGVRLDHADGRLGVFGGEAQRQLAGGLHRAAAFAAELQLRRRGQVVAAGRPIRGLAARQRA